jgi:hypothetical protein
MLTFLVPCGTARDEGIKVKFTPAQRKAFENIEAISADWSSVSRGEYEKINYFIPEEIIETSYGNGGIFNKSTGLLFSKQIDQEIKRIISVCEEIFIRNSWNFDEISNDIDFISIQKESKILREKLLPESL